MKAKQHSWRVRLEVVDENLRRLENKVDAFVATSPFEVVARRENDSGASLRVARTSLSAFVLPTYLGRTSNIGRTYDVAWYCQINHEPPARLAHDAGGIIEDLRSCLELIVFALAKEHSGPLTKAQEKSVAFPVRLDRGDYFREDKKGGPARGSGADNVRLLSPEAQAAVEELQPFQGLGSRNLLHLLNELRQQNFHREPLLAVSIGGMTRMGMNMNGANVSVPGNPDRPRAFRTGDEVHRVRVTEMAPGAMVEFFPQPTFQLAFSPDGPGQGFSMVPTLGALRDHLRDVVFAALEPFA